MKTRFQNELETIVDKPLFLPTRDEKPYKTIEIKVYDNDNNIEELLSYISHTGNRGHSFAIVVDPHNKDYTKTFGWDGDGSDRFVEIKVDGKKLK